MDGTAVPTLCEWECRPGPCQEAPTWHWPLAWARGWWCTAGKTPAGCQGEHLKERKASLGQEVERPLYTDTWFPGSSRRPWGLWEAGLHLRSEALLMGAACSKYGPS